MEPALEREILRNVSVETEEMEPVLLCTGMFKRAAVSAAKELGMDDKVVRRSFHVAGFKNEARRLLVEVKGKPQLRKDTIRFNGCSCDTVFRTEIPEWSVDLTCRFNSLAISVEDLIRLFNIAGFAIGVGERRPEKGGAHGTFHVKEKEADDEVPT